MTVIRTPREPSTVPAVAKWPNTLDPVAWLVCTAEWSLAVSPCNGDRSYLGLALTELARLGQRELVVRFARAWTTDPCEGDIAVRVAACEKLATTLVEIGDSDSAIRSIREILALIPITKRKSTIPWLADSASRLLEKLGGPKCDLPSKGKRALAAKLAWLDTALASRDLQLHAPRAVPPPVLPFLDRDAAIAAATAALTRLRPEELNPHIPAREIADAIEALCMHGDGAVASTVLSEARARFETGELDGRGFASGAARVQLSRAEAACGTHAGARRELERALMVAGDHRGIVLPAVVAEYAKLGDVDAAVAAASDLEGGARLQLTVEVLAGAGRMKEMLDVLASVRDPAIAVRSAWGVALLTLQRMSSPS
ncbi:MAG: hypothetical protein U0414_12550 [Polyangiaceae bacterium]